MKPLTLIVLICALLLHAPAILSADPGTGSGTVAEAIDAGSYTYLRLEDPDMWIATTPVAVSEGDRVRFSDGMEMKNFHSKALDRTFESVFFVQSVQPLGQGGEDVRGGDTQNSNAHHPPIPESNSIQAPEPGTIPKLKEGKTIADIFAQSTRLNGESVSLRAKVMKVSPKIMGKNWITMQDGTGAKPDNNIMATSHELVTAGDLVIARGILREDVDIGAGYRYKVLLEDVSFTQNPE